MEGAEAGVAAVEVDGRALGDAVVVAQVV